MQRSIFVVFVIFTLAMLIFLPNITTYATHSPIMIYGTINEDACRRIGGIVVTDAIDAKHTHIVELCKFDSRYFWIENRAAGCVESVGLWKDPMTEKNYGFPTPCDVPRPCIPSKNWTWAFWSGPYQSRIQVIAEEKQFDVAIRSQGIMCDFKFVQEEKKISIIEKGKLGTKASLEIAIPSELLDGEFEVMIDGTRASFSKTSFSPIAIDPQDNRKAKFDPAGFYEKILSMINAGETREYGVLVYVVKLSKEGAQENKDKLVDALVNVHRAKDVHRAEFLSFVTARVPVEEIPKLADYSYVGIIHDAENSLVLGSLPSSTITIGFEFSQSGNFELTERKIDIIGTQVIPEFPVFGLIIFAFAISLILATRPMLRTVKE